MVVLLVGVVPLFEMAATELMSVGVVPVVEGVVVILLVDLFTYPPLASKESSPKCSVHALAHDQVNTRELSISNYVP